MKKALLIILGGLMTIISGAEASTTKTFGYVPVTFPRDPADVNQFAEHIILGQIIEPLVDTDKLGNVVAGIAESWVFEMNGSAIRFKLKPNLKFSNGKKLDSIDVKYTIDRIIEKKSQSSNFLSSIEKTECPSADTFLITLRQKDVSILKALSRDQTGIVPSGWKFDSNSTEPIVGSGAYRLLKKGADWHLELNRTSKISADVAITDWKLVYFLDQNQKLPSAIIPDYSSGISLGIKSEMASLPDFKKLKVVPQISFAQTSAWWHPLGKHFTSTEFRKRVMTLVEDYISTGVRKLELERATGVIPKGVAGHSTVSNAPEPYVRTGKSLEPVRFVFVGTGFDSLLREIELDKFGQKHGFKVETLVVAPAKVGTLAELKPDVIFAGWAGGFNDPEGFIALLSTFLTVEFKSYLSAPDAEKYSKAKQEQDWTKRSELFRQINETLRSSWSMVPGWKIPFFIAGQSSLISEEATFRYTPRLHTVKEAL